MSDLFWPGDGRAGDVFTEYALVTAMVEVEAAWLVALVALGIASPDAVDDLRSLVGPDDVAAVAGGSEAGGNPVIPLLALLRQRIAARNPAAAPWVHRGLTSQDVLDTALMLCTRDAIDRLELELRAQVAALAELVQQHRTTVMTGRTLTQHAVPITFGLKAAGWLGVVLDAAHSLVAVRAALPSQFGGAAGTLAAATELASLAGLDSPAEQAVALGAAASHRLRLCSRVPWHTSRAPMTGIGDALVRCTDAWGRIANDVLTLSRPELGEVAEPAADGCGGSSAMPQKVNPVLSVLIRRAALAAPLIGAQLHLAAADARDERPDGSWHVEWSALRTLGRHCVIAAAQTSELVTGLQVYPARMRETVDAAAHDLLTERRSLVPLFPDAATEPSSSPETYLGANELLIEDELARADLFLKEGG